MRHELKTDKEVFAAVWSGDKTYEIRKDDRGGFQCGDSLHLRETLLSGAEMAEGNPLVYTGREIVVIVSHVLHGPLYGLCKGWAILSFNQKITID